MTEKEDYIHNDPSPWRDKAIELLAKIKAERAGKEFVRIPLESGRGYYEIEKSKYEKRQRQQQPYFNRKRKNFFHKKFKCSPSNPKISQKSPE